MSEHEKCSTTKALNSWALDFTYAAAASSNRLRTSLHRLKCPGLLKTAAIFTYTTSSIFYFILIGKPTRLSTSPPRHIFIPSIICFSLFLPTTITSSHPFHLRNSFGCVRAVWRCERRSWHMIAAKLSLLLVSPMQGEKITKTISNFFPFFIRWRREKGEIWGQTWRERRAVYRETGGKDKIHD